MKTSIALLSSLGFAALLITGCGPSHRDLCDRAQECSGGSDEDIDACVVDLDRRAEIASIYECNDQWNAYIDCMSENAVCDGETLRGCGAQDDAVGNCVEGRRTSTVRVRLESE